MTAVVDGVVDIVDYDVYATEAPEEDEYIVARALADFVPEEEGRFIALEINAPVFIFTKHASGWWTGECKGKYGLFPSNFVTEEFQVTLRPKASDSNVVGGENDPGAIPVIAGGAETSSEDSDDDTDSDEEIDEMDEDDEDENNPNGSPPISIPNSAHATPEKSIPVPILSLPPSDSSFLLNDPSKLTPVSRQLGEFVDRLNESARTPPTSNPTTPTHASNSPRFATPQNPAQRKGAGSGLRVTRTDSVGSEDMLYDPEQSKLTPVSRQLGEFVERLNQGRPASVNMTSTSAGKGKGRNGEPIFNVFDGLLADIESLRNTGAAEGEWDDVDGVYNTPEAARARIAIDVQALRDELEQHKSARMSAESDIVRLREEFSAQLEVERKGRQILEKKLSERDPLLIVGFS